jgi:hypothetical protein
MGITMEVQKKEKNPALLTALSLVHPSNGAFTERRFYGTALRTPF